MDDLGATVMQSNKTDKIEVVIGLESNRLMISKFNLEIHWQTKDYSDHEISLLELQLVD